MSNPSAESSQSPPSSGAVPETATLPVLPPGAVTPETAFEILNGVQAQIQFADAKAGVISAALVILFGFMATSADGLQSVAEGSRGCLFWARVVLVAVYAGFTIIGFIYAVMSILPRMGESAPQCLLHFAHIHTKYGRDYARYCDDLRALDAKAWASQITSQIVENSVIANTKHRHIKTAIKWTVAAVAAWAIALAVTGISALLHSPPSETPTSTAQAS